VQVDAGREWRGGQDQVRLLCRGLARHGDVRVCLVTREESEVARRAAAGGVDVRGVAWRWAWDPRAAFELSGVLSHERPDVVHVHDAHSLTTARWAIGMAFWRRDPPAIVATRRVDFHLRRMDRWADCRAVIAVSEAVKRVIVADGVPATLVRVIPDGVDADEIRRAAAAGAGIRARLGIPDGAPLAVNLAALVDHKDHLTLVRAAAAARPARPDLYWVIAGAGRRHDAIERAINELDLSSRVRLVGYIEEADALISEATVLVMSSREEGLGSVVLHALALEKPVVATRAGGLPEIVAPEWLVDVQDAPALGAKVVKAVTERPRTTLPERHTADAMVAACVALYEGLT
jgi:glycosyltransferase involved in cell wall biosynthesis